MAQRIPTRLGDGSLVELTRGQIEADLSAGSEAAVKRAKVEPLTQDELDHLLDIFTSPAKFSAVDYGDEVILGFDGSGNADIGAPVLEQIVYQNHHGADMIELWHHDYSYKAVRTVLSFQTQLLKDAQQQTVIPLNYGAMPDLGRYSQPDGPCPNWSELMPLGRIAEARAAQEEAVEHAERDMWCVAEAMIAAGADGLDFDTAGASGDADLLATLRTARRLRADVPRHRRRDRPGGRAGARHARRARVRRRPAGRPVAARPAPRLHRRRRHDLRAGGEREHHEVAGVEHRPRLRAGEAGDRRGHHPRPHERGDGRRRRPHDPVPSR